MKIQKSFLAASAVLGCIVFLTFQCKIATPSAEIHAWQIPEDVVGTDEKA